MPNVFEDRRVEFEEALLPYVPGPTAASITASYGISLDAIVKLSSNEAPLGPSPRVREALKRFAASDEIHRYPSPRMEQIKALIAGLHGLRTEEVLLGAGSSETWAMLLRAYVQRRDLVAAVTPSMDSYLETAVLAGARTLKIDTHDPFDLDADAVIEAAHDAVVLFLNSPNNSTSRFIESGQVVAIAEALPSTIVVVDEHYIEAADDYRARTAVRLVGSVPNLLVTRSLSKMYGLAGMRIGYMVGPAAAIKVIGQYKPKWNVSGAAAVAAVEALSDEEHLSKNIAYTRQGRLYLQARLAEIGMRFVEGAQGGFLLVEAPDGDSVALTERLAARGVVVRGDLVPGLFRVSVGLPEQNSAFIDAIRDLTHER